jgi:hypothetical protein
VTECVAAVAGKPWIHTGRQGQKPLWIFGPRCYHDGRRRAPWDVVMTMTMDHSKFDVLSMLV